MPETAVDVNNAINANRMRTIALIAGFPLILPTIVAAIVLVSMLVGKQPNALSVAGSVWISVLIGVVAVTIVWLPIGYLINQWIIDRATNARLVGRHELTRLWAIFEPLCRKAGLRQPALRVIETDALNAYASGLRDGQYSVTVTSGLVNTLDDDELEGVLAHELAHIIHHDVRLLVAGTVLVGVIPMIHDMLMKGFWGMIMFVLTIYRGIFSLLPFPGAKLLVEVSYGAFFWAAKLIAYAVGFVGTMSSLVIHFAISRRREFMADAGAAHITGNPLALASALRRISGTATLEVALEGIRAMLFDSPAFGWGGLFATHPPIEARIEALQALAGNLGASHHEEAPRHERELPDPRESAPVRPQPAADYVSMREELPPRRAVPTAMPSAVYLTSPQPGPDPSVVARYVAILSAGRPEELDTAERKQLYRRARHALEQRKHADPPLPHSQIATAELSLEAAIRQIEDSL